MMINEGKICFITCVNDIKQYNTSLKYLDSLIIPAGIELEKICIENAEYLTKEYNKAMEKTAAKYKVYMHQDTYIINRHFINDIIRIFKEDKNVGMIGVVGAKSIPDSGLWGESPHKYGKLLHTMTGKLASFEWKEIKGSYESVKCIDGLIMITQYNIPWREDLFTGWHFYDLSQSIEFIRAGYKVVVPKQNKPWCMHDCGVDFNRCKNLEEFRGAFINEYLK
ncbi:glycosyltransferase family protein [Halocella sp. SP3-1]|uniref:glycosyltransferase family protein n=1 Tax=Halocella sp. SP3-1 TaxID=2382161 RepID=UPI000F7613F8|nr:glycosyltransferase family protein [Halocella sp. SP3-1]AZO94824.1 hypothetical protein D7D81_09580 [Halocella sp. SP3-1]